ncbi:MAG: OB-fold domain-containing protein [Candidatus Binatia bacterium]
MKPLPPMQGLAAQFYGYCRNRELRFQRCTSCWTWRHVPRATCAACGSWEFEWTRSTGRGRVLTWTVVRRPMHPAFAADVPYAPTVVELEEGVRMVASLVDVPPDEIRQDMPVEVVFDAVTPDVTLPRFRPSTRRLR